MSAHLKLRLANFYVYLNKFVPLNIEEIFHMRIIFCVYNSGNFQLILKYLNQEKREKP